MKGHVDPGTAGELMFISIMGFHVALEGITGDITPQNVIATIKKMPTKLLPGGGGLHFRCNGKAVPGYPALCDPRRARHGARRQGPADGVQAGRRHADPGLRGLNQHRIAAATRDTPGRGRR